MRSWNDFFENPTDFSLKFLGFESDTIEKWVIINLNSDNSYIYAYVVLRDFEVAFLGEEKDTTFRPFLYYVLVRMTS